MELILSRYLRVRERPDWVAVFHELHPNPVYCRTEEWRSFSSRPSSDTNPALYAKLRDHRLLVNTRAEDDLEFANAARKLEQKLDRPSILYLMLAEGCDLNCAYCPIPKTVAATGRLLSQENAFMGMDLWFKHIRESGETGEFFLIFYGGEPLLNKPVFESVLERLRSLHQAGTLPATISKLLATNGMQLDDRTIEFCKEHEVAVTVGLDGPRRANRLRLLPDGQETFEAAVSAVKRLVAAGVRTCASVSLTPYNLEQAKQIASFFQELGVEKFGFNFLKGKALLGFMPPECIPDYYRAAAKAVLANFVNQGRPDYEYQMEKKWRAFHDGDFFPVDCTCYGSQLVILPDGQISNCPFRGTVFGKVGDTGPDFRISKVPLVREWRRHLPLYDPGYSGSDARSLCGGGCFWSSDELGGKGIDEGMKIFSEEAFDELIWSKF